MFKFTVVLKDKLKSKIPVIADYAALGSGVSFFIYSSNSVDIRVANFPEYAYFTGEKITDGQK